MTPSRLLLTSVGLALSTTLTLAQSNSDEDVARRQLESGRSFARQGNYGEALKDFRAVAETHASSTVADNALLEMARYYLDVVGDAKQASDAVDTILKKYATSDSAPEAYLMEGRLALARSHQPADLETALANFDRVSRLFPNSDAVPRSLVLAGEAFWYAGRYDDARASLARVEVESPADAAAADAYVNASRVLVSLGDPITAMEELQQVRNRWPNSPEAAAALARLTLLHRLYVRGVAGTAFAPAADAIGPAKLENVVALVMTPKNAMYFATESTVGLIAPATAEKPATAVKPRGLTLDTAGGLVIIDGGSLRPAAGDPLALAVPRPNDVAVSLEKIDAVCQLSNGDWLVMDADQKSIQRFSRAGEYSAPFGQARVSKLAVNVVDEVAGLDRDQKTVTFFDASGKLIGRLPFKGAGYDLQNPQDLAYDAFGHLYVLDREGLAVFSPYGPAAAAAPAGRATASTPSGRGAQYRLLTFYSEPEKSPAAFRKATAFALDASGAVFIFDDNAKKIRVYR